MHQPKPTPQLPHGIPAPTFRLPDAAHLGAVHLLVSDLLRSLEFYEQVLGLRSLVVNLERATLATYGDQRPLVELHTRTSVGPARRGALGLYHFAILLPDRAALGRFAAHSGSLGLRVGMADHLVSEALYLWDPDGLGVEVYADRPRSAWQHHGRELAMATDPLDFRSLVRQAAGVPWDGVPAGTSIGHVHLHVGNLERAEAFYHRALGFDKTVWSYPGALFMSAGGYHHHVATNVWSSEPGPAADEAQLLEWELHVPSNEDVAAVERSLRTAGYETNDVKDGIAAEDPWRIRVSILQG